MGPHYFILFGSGYAGLGEVAHALTAAELKSEHPLREPFEFDSFDFHMSVLPLNAGERVVRFQVNQGMREDGAPFAADIRFVISNKEAANLARDLRHWLTNKKYAFEWKP